MKQIIYNKYLISAQSIVLFLFLSLIPWIDFINSNYRELEFILNDNFFILILIYFLLITIIFLFAGYISKQYSFHLSFLVSFIIWIFFTHRNFKSKISEFLNNSIFSEFSSELALILILVIIFFSIFFYRKKFLRLFLIFFMLFNLISSAVVLVINYNNYYNQVISTPKETVNKEISIKKKNHPNIYFFIIDAMMPLDKFERFYEIDLNNFKNMFRKNDFVYYENTFNIYKGTAENFTSLFFLEDIYASNSDADNKILKKNIFAKFPTILKETFRPKLISDLNHFGYGFKWVGNIYADCSKYNYKYCLTNKKENYIDLYLLQAFLQKTPLLQIFNIITDIEVIKKNLEINNKLDSINKFNKFIVSNQDYLENNRPTFFFIHDLQTHWPYVVDKNCDYKNFDGKLNIEGYKNSYLCAIKKISEMITILDKFEKDSIIVFQSDHNWEMSSHSEKKYGNRKEIFNLIKLGERCNKNLPKDLNNIGITKHILSCLKDL